MNSNKKKPSPICDFLQEIRENYKHTQSNTSELLNISKQAYSHYEDGSNRLPVDVMKGLSRLYGVDVSEFLVRMDEEEYASYCEERRLVEVFVEVWKRGSQEPGRESRDRLRWLNAEECEVLDYFRSMPAQSQDDLLMAARFRKYINKQINPADNDLPDSKSSK